MANVETIRDEYTFLVQAGATYEHIFYERRLGLQVYYYFVERSGRAVAHDEERRAFERFYGWAKGLPQVQMDTWAALRFCRFRDGSGM